jgi:hypothetical protein
MARLGSGPWWMMQRGGYVDQTIVGWRACVAIADWRGLDQRLCRAIELKLREIARLIPAKAYADLRARVPLVLDLATSDCAAVAVYHWCGCGPELMRTGEPSWKAGSVNVLQGAAFLDLITDAQRFPYALLHELAHAFQDHLVPDSHRNHAIRSAHHRALASGDYDMVMNVAGMPRKANAIIDPLEYFASSSTAYFARNDDWPTDRDELAAVDPVACALVQRLWGA